MNKFIYLLKYKTNESQEYKYKYFDKPEDAEIWVSRKKQERRFPDNIIIIHYEILAVQNEQIIEIK